MGLALNLFNLIFGSSFRKLVVYNIFAVGTFDPQKVSGTSRCGSRKENEKEEVLTKGFEARWDPICFINNVKSAYMRL